MGLICCYCGNLIIRKKYQRLGWHADCALKYKLSPRRQIKSKAMFETEALSESVKKALINVPEGHKVATLTVANSRGVGFVTAIKINDEWDVKGYVQVSKATIEKNKVNVDWGIAVQWSK